MAIKERLIKAVEKGQKAFKRKSNADYEKAVYALKTAKILCRQGLPENSFNNLYAEIFDGLLLANNELTSGKTKDSREIKSLCNDLFKLLLNQIQKETKFKKEIFFLPYKASMWDSLESVWKAANDDMEHCISYVMPIPYANRNPDMSLTEFHCERSEFPSYVSTLDWQKVDLMAWHPDIIFFHNPYDYQNNVTSVMEKYYSVNLKLCADKLVYIPYFVTGGKNISEHFCEAPGVLNADHVIVESEAIKKIYERVHRKYSEPAPDKFLALGSPKYDKVINAKKEDYPLPPEWEKIIAGRKVILYLTSLSAFLQYPNNMLDKLVSVLEFFKERTDVAFWWRPHPLMEATIASRSPEIAEVYRKIVRLFIDEGWGIFDDTAELDRAICWSDAYYGDMSSVVSLYQKTGKPVVLESIKSGGVSLTPTSLMPCDDKIRFLNYFGNLGIIDRGDKSIKYLPINHLKVAPFFQQYSSISKINDEEAILAPFYGNDFYKCNFVSNKIEEIYTLDFYGMFSFALDYCDKMLFVSLSQLFMLVYDKNTSQFFKLSDKCNFKDIISLEYGLGYFATKDHAFIIARNTNKLLEIDMLNYNMNIIQIGNVDTKIDRAISNEKYVCFKTFDNMLICWSYFANSFHSFPIPKDFVEKDMGWPSWGISDKYLYVMTIRLEYNVTYIFMDIESGEFSEEKELAGVTEVHEFKSAGQETFWLGCCGKNGDFLALYDLQSGECLESYTIVLDDEYIRKYLDCAWRLDNKNSESAPVYDCVADLSTLCEYIYTHDNSQFGQNLHKAVGAETYRIIRGIDK